MWQRDKHSRQFDECQDHAASPFSSEANKARISETGQTRQRGDSSFPAGYLSSFTPLRKLVFEMPRTERTVHNLTTPSGGNDVGTYVILLRGLRLISVVFVVIARPPLGAIGTMTIFFCYFLCLYFLFFDAILRKIFL
jgi:hypothetical protein